MKILKRTIAILLSMALLILSGCLKSDTNADAPERGTSGAFSETVGGQLLEDEMASARNVTLSLGEEARDLEELANVLVDIRDQGLDLLELGLTRQASYFFSFAGGSASSLRLLGQVLLGQEPTGFADWETIGAISWATPLPFLCEAVAAEYAGNAQKATECRDKASYNPVELPGIDGLNELTKMSQAGLEELVENLSAFEKHIYWYYPADPIAEERTGMEWSAEYHLMLAGAFEELGKIDLATEAYLNALTQDPFSPDILSLCAKHMYTIGELELMYTYVDEGLYLEPNHGACNVLMALLQYADGNMETAKQHLAVAKTQELTGDDAAIYEALVNTLEGGT